MQRFLAELKQRKVYKVAVVYAAVAWLLLQLSDVIISPLGLPEWSITLVLVIAATGFPIALVLAWVFDLTREGVTRTKAGRSAQPPPLSFSRLMEFALIGVLVFAVGYLYLDRLTLQEKNVEAKSGVAARSVAVLPFTNLSGDESNEAFTNGIHDDLVSHVSRISSIRTISRTSVLQYRETTKTIPEIAKELDVAAVLEGGVQRVGDRVRINAQLIDAGTDSHLWADSFDRELTAHNVFSIQSEIAMAIANALQVELTADEQRRLVSVPTNNIAALETYFIGKRMLEDRTKESLLAAVEYFEKVIELDPNFALAYSGLADAYMLLPEYSASVDRGMVIRKSDSAVENALKLDPDLPEVITSLAWNRLIHEYDWKGAEETFSRALEIQSNNTNALHWISHTLSWQGRHEEALEYARRAVSVDPLSLLMQMNLVYIMVDSGQYDAALELGEQLKDREPGYDALRRNLWLHELRAGRPESAARGFSSWAAITNADLEAAEEVGQMFISYARNGTVGDLSQDLISRLKLGAEDLPQVYAFIGNREGTLDALEQAAAGRTGSRSVLSMKVNPGYDFIREDLRFKTLLEKVGLSE
jgi:TolB-like protein